MPLLKDAYNKKKVLLTGHTGFKGSWLTYWLHSMGAEVIGCALTAPENGLYRSIDGDQYCRSHLIDIREPEPVAALMDEVQPDYVFHLAAQSLVGESYEAPINTFATNVMGTANVLEALKVLKSDCAAIIVTTDKVYENLEWVYPYRENDSLGGHDPYSSSKACAEIVTDSYRRSFFPPALIDQHHVAIATARAGNVIGGGDWNMDHLVPDIVNAIARNEPIPVRNPDSIRPWQHVLEPLYGYLLLATSLSESPAKISGAWNFGPPPTDTVTVENFVQRAIKIWGQGEYVTTPRENAVHEAMLLRLDSSKAQTLLHWSPAFSVDKAIDLTLSWYRNYSANPSSAAELVHSDIDTFCELVS